MAIINDQTIAGNFDPGASGLPFAATIITMEINDADDDGVIRADGIDQINGSNLTAVWVGDTITLDGVVIQGVRFYTADGGRYFTPSDGLVLTDGTITAMTFFNTSTQFPVSRFGPPCFVAGTKIQTPRGAVAVEELAVGDLVATRDHGSLAIRWIGPRTVAGRGAYAPVRFGPNTLGNHGEVIVSPQHRILVGGWRAELYLDESEALCPAHMMVNGDTIHRAPFDRATYVHVMLDANEIIFADGLAIESFLFWGI